MRKRIIGLIAVVVIAVGAYVLSVMSEPRRGSVEYHKREYLRAYERGSMQVLVMQCPRAVQEAYWERKEKLIDFHREALIDAGYLMRKEYVISNRTPTRAMEFFSHAIHDGEITLNKPAYPIIHQLGDRITVIGLAGERDKFDGLIRGIDVPQSK